MNNKAVKHIRAKIFVIVLSIIFTMPALTNADDSKTSNNYRHTFCGDLYSSEGAYWCITISIDYKTELDANSGILLYDGVVNQRVVYYDRSTDEELITIPEHYKIERNYDIVGIDTKGEIINRIDDMIKDDFNGLVDLHGKCVMHDLVWHINIMHHVGAANKDNLFHSCTPIVSSDILCGK